MKHLAVARVEADVAGIGVVDDEITRLDVLFRDCESADSHSLASARKNDTQLAVCPVDQTGAVKRIGASGAPHVGATNTGHRDLESFVTKDIRAKGNLGVKTFGSDALPLIPKVRRQRGEFSLHRGNTLAHRDTSLIEISLRFAGLRLCFDGLRAVVDGRLLGLAGSVHGVLVIHQNIEGGLGESCLTTGLIEDLLG